MRDELFSTHGMKFLMILVAFILCGAGIFTVFSSIPESREGRATNPPGKPKEENPRDGTTGITDGTIKLSWVPEEVYRGDHKTITNTRLKVSTKGPCNSDNAAADIMDEKIGPANNYQLSGQDVRMGTTYYWAVKNKDEDGWGPYSNWKFTTNAFPTASIKSISPSVAREGQEVRFVGEGADTVDNDDIDGYKWESDRDGELSEKKSFTTSELETPLSPGIHQITFRVKDVNDLWSEITDQSKRNLEIKANTPPSKPTGLEIDGDTIIDDGELTTHELSPRIKWTPSTDPDPEDENDLVYYISISVQRTYERSIANEDEINVPEYTVKRKLSYGKLDSYTNTMSNTYYIELYASDGYKRSETITTEFNVINHPPEAPSTEIQPESPGSGDPLFCHILPDSPSKDSDGDTIRYVYKWYKNDRYQEDLSGEGADKAEVPDTKTKHFETWKVEVIPTDGTISGEKTVLEKTIGNEAPKAKFKNPYSITRPQYTDEGYYPMEKIPLDAGETEDPDGDFIKEYLWTSNISGLIGKGASLKITLAPGTHEITLKVKDKYGATSNTSRTVRVLAPPLPLLAPEFTFDDEGPFRQGETVGPISVWIRNIGNDNAVNLTVRVSNNGEVVPGISTEKIDSLAQNMTHEFKIEEFEIDTDTVNLRVNIEGKNGFGQTLSTGREGYRGELDYSNNSLTLEVVGSARDVSGSRSGWFKDNWIWVVLGVLLFLVLIAAGTFIWVSYGEGEPEEGEEAEPEAPEGYTVGSPDTPAPPSPPQAPFPGLHPNAQSTMLLPPGPDFGGGEEARSFMPQRLALPAAPDVPGGYPGSGGAPPGHLPGIPNFQRGPPSRRPSPFSSIPQFFQPSPSRTEAHQREGGGTLPSRGTYEGGPEASLLDESEDEVKEGPSCSNCGAKVEEGWLMCPECKSRLR